MWVYTYYYAIRIHTNIYVCLHICVYMYIDSCFHLHIHTHTWKQEANGIIIKSEALREEYRLKIHELTRFIHIWHVSFDIRHVTFLYYMAHSYVTWLIFVWHGCFNWDMSDSFVTRSTDSKYTNSPGFIRMWHDPFISDTMHDSFMSYTTHLCVTWLIHMFHDSFQYDMTHSNMPWLLEIRHDTFLCDMAHSYVTWLLPVWHALFIGDISHSFVTFSQGLPP